MKNQPTELYPTEGDLGESISIEMRDPANDSRAPVATVLNFDDFPCAEESQAEEIDMLARSLAAIFATSPKLLLAVRLSYDFANTEHMLTNTAREQACQQVFEACRDALADVQRHVPKVNLDYVLEKYGWKETDGERTEKHIFQKWDGLLRRLAQ